jgi:uncharacterized protein (TIGR00730 family)
MAETDVRPQSDLRQIEREKAIDDFLNRFAPSPDQDLLGEMLVTVTRLAKDATGRGELKLLSRAFKELRYAFKVFAPFHEIRKVSIFGSSRTPIGHPDYAQADAFARRMRQVNWMVITGAGDGIMRAGCDGAGREGSFGVAIRLPFEQKTNTIIADDAKLVNFKYFFTRKLLFLKEASAVVLFPGGFGTQDEGFEALTLIQTGKAEMMPVIMIDSPGGTYWQHWRTWVNAELLRTGMISPEDVNLFRVTDDVEVAVQEIVQFYKRYHSSRYVGDLLVLRLNSPISAQTLEKLNDTYGGMLAGGKIEQFPGPIEGENGERPEMTRLALKFNRRSAAQLRMMINEINKA